MRDFVRAQDAWTPSGSWSSPGSRRSPSRRRRERDGLLRAIDAADDRPRHDDRRRDPEVRGRDRRDRPRREAVGHAARHPTPDRRLDADTRDCSAGGRPGTRRTRVRAGDRRPAHRRRQHPRRRPGGRRQQARPRGVRVYPIGFGTTNPTPMVCTARPARRPRVPGVRRRRRGRRVAGRRGRNFLVADEETLKQVAAMTGGGSSRRATPGSSRACWRTCPRNVDDQAQDVEMSAGLVALAQRAAAGRVGRGAVDGVPDLSVMLFVCRSLLRTWPT